MAVLTLENRISVLILFLSELKVTLLCTAPATETFVLSFRAKLGVVANKEKYIHVHSPDQNQEHFCRISIGLSLMNYHFKMY